MCSVDVVAVVDRVCFYAWFSVAVTATVLVFELLTLMKKGGNQSWQIDRQTDRQRDEWLEGRQTDRLTNKHTDR